MAVQKIWLVVHIHYTNRISLPGVRLASLIHMIVRLTRKLAERIDGVDLKGKRVGQLLNLPLQAARLLILEGWAEMVERRQTPRFSEAQ